MKSFLTHKGNNKCHISVECKCVFSSSRNRSIISIKVSPSDWSFSFSFSCSVLSNGYGGNSALTPSARISALNIVSDLLRKVGVSHSVSDSQNMENSPSFQCEGEHHLLFYISLQALESKLAACRNFAKDQKARKAYALENSNILNGNTTNYSQSFHTSYFDKAWVKKQTPNLPSLHLSSLESVCSER